MSRHAYIRIHKPHSSLSSKLDGMVFIANNTAPEIYDGQVKTFYLHKNGKWSHRADLTGDSSSITTREDTAWYMNIEHAVWTCMKYKIPFTINEYPAE